jgi:hypothetical protein
MSKKFLSFLFAIMILAGGLVYEASAQTRRGTVVVRRPVIVRQYVYSPYRYSPYWGSRYWGYTPYAYSGFYDPYYYQTPYQRFLEQRYQAQRELAGNRRELAEHQRKYNADGVLTEKERRELADDIKDVREAEARLRYLNRNY